MYVDTIIKFLQTDNSLHFVVIIIRNFQSTVDAEDSFIIPTSLFDEKNERKSKDFVEKFHHFTNRKYPISINWITKEINNLLLLKDRNI